MNNVVPIQAQQPIRARDYNPSQLALIKRTVAKDTTDDEFSMFVEVCRRVGLDPFRKQIYCLVYSKDNAAKRKVVFITGIDGFRAVAARNGDYRPDEDEPDIRYKDDLKDPATNPLGIERAIVRAFKRSPNGDWHKAPGIAYWDEFAPLKEIWAYSEAEGKKVPSGKFTLDKTSNWYRMGRVMIAKCAEAQALRRGWPEDLSGIHAPEEMAQAVELDAAEEARQSEEQVRLERVNATHSIPILWEAGQPIEFVPHGKMADKCIAHIRNIESPTGLAWWRDTNREGLRQFWAVAGSDALEVKRTMEDRIKSLGEATNE